MHTVPHKQHTSFYNYFAILLKGWSYELYTTICTAPASPQHVLAPLECMADGDDCILCALAALLCRASVLCHIVACANIVLHVCSRGKKKRGAKAQKPSPPQRGRYHPFLDHDKALLHSFAKSTAVTPNCVSHTPYHGDHLPLPFSFATFTPPFNQKSMDAQIFKICKNAPAIGGDYDTSAAQMDALLAAGGKADGFKNARGDSLILVLFFLAEKDLPC